MTDYPFQMYYMVLYIFPFNIQTIKTISYVIHLLYNNTFGCLNKYFINLYCLVLFYSNFLNILFTFTF